MFLFKPKKPEEEKKPEVSQANIDLEIDETQVSSASP